MTDLIPYAGAAESGFSREEIAAARQMRARGCTWNSIGWELGRQHGAGIRRRLDPEFREQSNAYQARWMRQRRAA